MTAGLICLDFAPFEAANPRSSLRGFARIKFERTGIIINGVTVHESHGRRWALPPARPMVDGGELVRDERGKIRYAALVNFPSDERRRAFSDGVVRAVDQFVANETAAQTAVNA